MPLTDKVCSGLFNHLGSNKNICSFTLVLEGNASKEIPESWRLEFLEKLLIKNFALSDGEDNNSDPLSRGDITD